MLKLLFLWVAILFISPLTVQSQDISFCNGVNGTGQPINKTNSFNFSSSCGYVYCLVSNATAFPQSKYLLEIKKKDNNDYIPYESKLVTVQAGKNQAGVDIEFTNEGDYKCSLFDGKATLATAMLTISINKNGNTAPQFSNANYSDPNSTFYFLNSEILFADSIDNDGNAVNRSNEFAMKKNGKLITACITNGDKPFKQPSLTVSVYKKKGVDYSTLIETKTLTIDPELSAACFHYMFNQKGDYLVKIFTAKGVWINNGNISIK